MKVFFFRSSNESALSTGNIYHFPFATVELKHIDICRINKCIRFENESIDIDTYSSQ